MFYISFLHRIKEWIGHNRQNILLLVGILSVGALAFESGFLRGQLAQSEPLVISIPSIAESRNDEKTQTVSENPSANIEPKTSQTSAKQETGQCPFVGSRNSNKYHLATCAVVKRIKPENKVCFASKEEAEKRGYVPSCIK